MHAGISPREGQFDQPRSSEPVLRGLDLSVRHGETIHSVEPGDASVSAFNAMSASLMDLKLVESK